MPGLFAVCKNVGAVMKDKIIKLEYFITATDYEFLKKVCFLTGKIDPQAMIEIVIKKEIETLRIKYPLK
jgi:hypothetical protein